MGQITKVTPDMIQVANNVTSKTVGNTTSGISLTFDSNGVITSAANVTLSVANTQLTGTITATQLAANSVNSTIIAANTISNTNIQTGAVENYLRANNLDFGMRNRIINGAMAIDQRRLGSSLTVSPSNSVYFGIDRFQVWSFPVGAAGTWTWQRQTETPPAGFTYYGRATVTTPDSSVAGNDFYTIQQPIEGFTSADFDFGTANAKPFTVSFWVRSSVTGTFSCSSFFANSSQGYPLTYTINSANTWEYKTLSFPALTSSSISNTDKTNSVSLYLVFSLGMGSSFTGTAGVLATNAYAATGATNLISTNGATFDLTGVQLEEGSTATSFDYRPYAIELTLCSRYFQRYSLQSSFAFVGRTLDGNRVQLNFPLRVEMRATPSLITSAITGVPSVYFGTSIASPNGSQTYDLSGHESTSIGGLLITGGASYTANQMAVAQINGSIQLSSEI